MEIIQQPHPALPSKTTPTNPTSFLDLPAELRNQIYTNITRRQCPRREADVRRCMALLFVSRQVRAEFLPMLYGGSDLRFDFIRPAQGFGSFEKFVDGLGGKLRFVRRIAVDHCVLEDMDRRHQSGMFFATTTFAMDVEGRVHIQVASETGRDMCCCLVKDCLRNWLEGRFLSSRALREEEEDDESSSQDEFEPLERMHSRVTRTKRKGGEDLIEVLLDWKRLFAHDVMSNGQCWGLNCYSPASCGGFHRGGVGKNEWKLDGLVRGVPVVIEGRTRTTAQYFQELSAEAEGLWVG
ncbi:hypothetical protein D0869_03922 [Hortaea werneckii]|uniref:F-box domain-containing protein n=1 Tax=Hortaea werneckii TaxID=91943 RepID=A0A3M6ZQ61_HORWE|nr:hypothetical protein KC334_g6048 [Hortaea werneckii]KAI6994687.1 hypothetical protein KC355_g10266 [Hortaea werneckii]KAI7185269.1 hypothetical protein KC324_g7475 [Hortaea werneckii]KAI7582799.1 hypothetical protein KC316_g7658 [Hortaea werneckii]KAI7660096.1 hypothetical protein KC318_g10300 [Hortaea werneckii]